jgi:hypothetical protein
MIHSEAARLRLRARRRHRRFNSLLRNCLQVLVLATSNAQLPPPAGPREDLIEAATTPLLSMALYSLVRAFFEAPREWAADFV